MDWRDWGDEKFPVNREYNSFPLGEMAERMGAGVIVGFQFAWTDSGGKYYKAYWCKWDVKNGQQNSRTEPIDMPPALIYLFPFMYERPSETVIPIVGLTHEEWSALWEGENGEGKP